MVNNINKDNIDKKIEFNKQCKNIIEEHIDEFKKKKPLFFQKKKLEKYNKRMNNLISVKNYIEIRLEYLKENK